MGIYKNDYKKEEDEILWELHEIRHALHKANNNKPVQQLNKEALAKFKLWRRGGRTKKSISV